MDSTDQYFIVASPSPSERRSQLAAEVAAARNQLAGYCARILRCRSAGEDAAQDALLAAWTKVGDLGVGTPIRPWLFRIARNRCIDLIRKQRRRAEADRQIASLPPPASPAPDRAHSRDALRRVMTLARRERQCFLLKHVLGASLAETAHSLGIPVGAVKAALHRAKARIAVELSAGSEVSPLLARYQEAFQRSDWAGVNALAVQESEPSRQARVRTSLSGDVAA